MLLLGINWLFLILVNVQMEQAKVLEDFRWKNRVFIINASPLDEIEEKQFEDRKLLYFQFQEDRLETSNYEGEINLESFMKIIKAQPTENWYLIGLDGGVKRTGKGSPNVDQIWEIIDAMPMRQSEIRKEKKDGIFKKCKELP
ncbi:DUF4174 domain-containing protein [Algoriphagus sp.]|uniref:DUF4174 domain-containing protein n=1 Tax=Algoriphagus sp. TaxID=1872435 RepID=UPI0026041FBF|nr:DUF4174 domain-containing protein [Algoriphagus sp.]